MDSSEVAIKRTAANVAHFSGLQTCGSVWACPVCQAKILNRRAEDASTAAATWHDQGNTVLMITLTMPHDAGMRLAPLFDTVANGFRSVISGRAWIKTRDRLAIVGTIRSVEVTHGPNGWHPHLHVLVFTRGRLNAEGIADLSGHVRAKWDRFITKAGYRQPDRLHGVVIQVCQSAAEAGAYIAKTQDGKGVGNEIARGDLKQGRNGHRTPLEILESFRWTGDVEDLALWNRYELATKGRQRITWSRGLRALLLPDTPAEQTDEEVAAEDVGGQVVALIDRETWRTVTRTPGLAGLILDTVEQGGTDALGVLMAGHGLGWTMPPDRDN